MCDSDSDSILRIIVPPGLAYEAVQGAGRIYLRACPCRSREQACPPGSWEVCLLFEGAEPGDLRDARPATREEALAILRLGAERRFMHQLFFRENSRQLTELCTCCTCCCRPLRRIRNEARYAQELRSDWVAVTDAERCTGCGQCEAWCFFEARHAEAGRLRLEDTRCFGCGRCVDACPEGAIRLERRPGRGLPVSAARLKLD